MALCAAIINCALAINMLFDDKICDVLLVEILGDTFYMINLCSLVSLFKTICRRPRRAIAIVYCSIN